jgi:hypothetical protein
LLSKPSLNIGDARSLLVCVVVPDVAVDVAEVVVVTLVLVCVEAANWTVL